MKNAKRIASMDSAKGLAVIAVVIGHAGSPFTNFLYLFHVPLFFFISGYFYKDLYTSNPLLFLRKRFRSLYIPFFLWEVAFLALHNVFYSAHMYDSNYGNHIKPYTTPDFVVGFINIVLLNRREEMAAIFWFFIVLIEVSVLFVLISYFLKHMLKKIAEVYRASVFGGLFLLGCFFSMFFIKLPKGLDIVFTLSLFYYAGYLFHTFEKRFAYKFSYFATGFAFLVVSSFFGKNELSDNYFPNAFFLLSNAFIGIYSILYLSKKLQSKHFHILNYIGRNTIPLLALHLLSFKLVSYIQIKIHNHPDNYLAAFPILDGTHGWWIAYSLVGILLPIVLLKITNKGKRYLSELHSP